MTLKELMALEDAALKVWLKAQKKYPGRDEKYLSIEYNAYINAVKDVNRAKAKGSAE